MNISTKVCAKPDQSDQTNYQPTNMAILGATSMAKMDLYHKNLGLEKVKTLSLLHLVYKIFSFYSKENHMMLVQVTNN